MKASDLLRAPQLKLAKEEGEEYQAIPKQSQVEWFELSQTFLNPVSHAETNIVSEAELELARKELERQGIIKKEKIEKKTYQAHYTQTIKPYILGTLAARLHHIADHLQDLAAEEEHKRATIRYFQSTEFIKRKTNTLSVHLLDKIFLPLATIEQGLSEAFLQCIFFFNGTEHQGYLIEPEVPPFSAEDKALLAENIQVFRDRAKGTQIIQEYFTKKERAAVQRVHTKPDAQSPYAVFLLGALKTDYTFEEAVALLLAKPGVAQ